ncbi:MAG: TRAM domain-containing protein, partial [Pseudomonadales bacterium]
MRSKPPKLIDVSIESIGSDGIGVAKVENRTVRVKNALPGESVSARVLRSRKGEWLSEALEVSRPASLRIDPPCSYYPRCGGCAMQHLAYDSQIELKQQRLLDELSAVGVQPLVVNPATLGPRLNYRTKARFGVRLVDGQVLVGFRESFSSRVSRMDGCLTLVSPVARLLAPLQRLIAALSCPDRIPQVEVAAGDGSSALIFRHLEAFTEPDQQLIEEFAHTHQVKCFGQSGSVATVRPLSASARMPYLG